MGIWAAMVMGRSKYILPIGGYMGDPSFFKASSRAFGLSELQGTIGFRARERVAIINVMHHILTMLGLPRIQVSCCGLGFSFFFFFFFFRGGGRLLVTICSTLFFRKLPYCKHGFYHGDLRR